jgi:dihydrofolate reductase
VTRARFTLLVATSRDGFIARHPGENPVAWASAEDQARFRAAVTAADWSVLGRTTHGVAPNPQRRRIVFSTAAGAPVWRESVQLWLDPAGQTPDGLAALVAAVHPLRTGLILGGTRVHDWFLAHGAIDRVELTVEPVTFGRGVPIFSGQGAADPVDVFRRAGFAVIEETELNQSGTRYAVLEPTGE